MSVIGPRLIQRGIRELIYGGGGGGGGGGRALQKQFGISLQETV